MSDGRRRLWPPRARDGHYCRDAETRDIFRPRMIQRGRMGAWSAMERQKAIAPMSTFSPNAASSGARMPGRALRRMGRKPSAWSSCSGALLHRTQMAEISREPPLDSLHAAFHCLQIWPRARYYAFTRAERDARAAISRADAGARCTQSDDDEARLAAPRPLATMPFNGQPDTSSPGDAMRHGACRDDGITPPRGDATYTRAATDDDAARSR